MTTLILIRHGETDWNRARRVQGSTDIPLNDLGRDQARRAGDLLQAEFDGAHTPFVYASDLSRASETAAIIAEAIGAAAPVLHPGLRERAYGEAEGMAAPEFVARYGAWLDAEIPGAEHRDRLRERAVGAVTEIARDVRRATAPADRPGIVVAHGGVIRELIVHASGGAFPLPGERLANTSMHRIRVESAHMVLLDYAAG